MSWVLNGVACSRLGSSDQHLLHLSPSRSETKRFRKVLINEINGVSERVNYVG